MNGDTGPTWQTCMWISFGCYSLFYIVTNILTDRVVGSPKPPGSSLPMFMLAYLLVVLVAGYLVLLGHRAEFISHTPGQLAASLLAGGTCGAGLVFFILSANRAGHHAGRQATIIAVSGLTPVLALLILFALDAWKDGANAKNVALRAIGATLAIVGGVVLAVYSE